MCRRKPAALTRIRSRARAGSPIMQGAFSPSLTWRAARPAHFAPICLPWTYSPPKSGPGSRTVACAASPCRNCWVATLWVIFLCHALADYLNRSRGTQCKPEQVMIVSGTQEALDLAARADPQSGRPGLCRGAGIFRSGHGL